MTLITAGRSRLRLENRMKWNDGACGAAVYRGPRGAAPVRRFGERLERAA
jgi:hypothetical protein